VVQYPAGLLSSRRGRIVRRSSGKSSDWIRQAVIINQRPTVVVPSPGGEGQDEGGRQNTSQMGLTADLTPRICAASHNPHPAFGHPLPPRAGEGVGPLLQGEGEPFAALVKNPATGYARWPSMKLKMDYDCSFSPGEKVRRRADVKAGRLWALDFELWTLKWAGEQKQTRCRNSRRTPRTKTRPALSRFF
jgi:hypothetical protein